MKYILPLFNHDVLLEFNYHLNQLQPNSHQRSTVLLYVAKMWTLLAADIRQLQSIMADYRRCLI